MYFLIAMKRLLAYNSIPKEVVLDTMDHIITEEYLKPLQEKMDKETDEKKKDELTKEYMNWSDLLQNKMFIAIVNQLLKQFKGGYHDNRTNRVIRINDSQTEDFVADAITVVYKERKELANKAKTPKDFVNLIKRTLQYNMIDALRKQAIHEVGESFSTTDEEGESVSLVEQQGELMPEGGMEDIIKDLKNYVQRKSSNEVINMLLEEWLNKMKHDREATVSEVVPIVADKVDLSEVSVFKYLKELRTIVVRFFENELDFAMPAKLKEKFKTSSKIASKLAIEYTLAYEGFRRAVARCILGSVYSELKSGTFVSPRDMVKSIVNKK